jgi:hypothetical protein
VPALGFDKQVADHCLPAMSHGQLEAFACQMLDEAGMSSVQRRLRCAFAVYVGYVDNRRLDDEHRFLIWNSQSYYSYTKFLFSV